ncbi:hypothetical protein ABZ517_23290 [Streptomyces scabiei]|uniref:hypothetical protein n=1 Tax=Streptomyces scabiei TaxID=1930 RepID=UPI0033D5F956
MCRIDSLGEVVGERGMPKGAKISTRSSLALWVPGGTGKTGPQVKKEFGFTYLFHYTRSDVREKIEQGGLGRVDGGVIFGYWLTPISYSACMAPYRLAPSKPYDTCIAIKVEDIKNPCLWGPGRVKPEATTASETANIWKGGGIEFYCTDVIPSKKFLYIDAIDPCGDAR